MPDQKKQKCPNCGAPLRYDPASGRLVCDYCDSSFEIKEEKKEKQEIAFDFSSLDDRITHPDAENLPIYVCRSCGAELIAPIQQSALTCPYCGNNIVLTDKVSGMLRPNGVIPFRITSEQLPDAVNRFYKGKKLLPKNFFSESSMGKVTGVYAPFWVFSGNLSGRVNLNAENTHTHRQGDYLITDVTKYRLVRQASLDFADLPVDAGEKIDDALMDSLEPFNMNEVQPFDMRYLAGFTAERFDESKQNVAERAEKRMRSTAYSAVNSAGGAGYGSTSIRDTSLKANLDAKYILFPVYMFDIKYGKKDYHFAVNGQTGKVVGEVPTSKSVSRGYFLKRFGIVAGILVVFSVVKYFMGG